MKKELILIQYLFDASSGDESFQERFHSFLDQIPKSSGASAAPEKEGFFINFFAGMFASLRSTELAEKLGLKDLYFCLVEKKLHIIAETGKEKKKHLFIFSESKDGKSNGELEAEIKNIGKGLSATKVLIGREILEEEGQKWKFKVLVANQKGNDPEINGSFKKVDCKADKNLEESVVELAKEDNNENIDGAKKAVGKTIQEAEKLYSDLKGKNLVQNIGKEAAQHGFISGMLMNFRYRYNLRLYLELLTGRGYSDIVLLVRGEGRSWKAIPVIMELKAKGSVENALVEAESYAKGLRRNKIRILTNAGRAICIGVNLNEQEDTYIISDAPFKIERNKEPVMQSLLDIVCGYGTDKDKKSKVKSLLGELYYTFPPEQYTQDYLSRFLLGQLLLLKKPQKAKDIDMYLFNHSGKDILGGNIKNNLTTYMVVVKGIKNQNRVVIFHMQEAGSKKFEYNKYSFYEEVLDEIGLKVVNNPDLIEVYVNGYKKTGPSQSALSPGSFYLDQDLVEIKNKKRFDYFRDSSSIGREMRSKTEQNKFIGKVEKILLWIKGTLRKKLIEKFKEAIDYQQKELRKRFEEEEKKLRRGVNKFELGEYKNFFDMIKELMCDRDGKPKKAFVSMISNENRLKAFLDGLFTGLSDLDRDRIIAVLTEFQVGEGLRADMMMQVVDINNPNKKKKVEELKQSVSMGFEVKYSTTKKEADRKLQNADGQIEGYARCKNIKSITEGDDVAFIGVSFNQGAGSKDELILLSENLIVAGVPHSSTDVSLRSQMSELSLPSASMQNPQPSTSKRERSYHRG